MQNPGIRLAGRAEAFPLFDPHEVTFNTYQAPPGQERGAIPLRAAEQRDGDGVRRILGTLTSFQERVRRV